MKKILTLFAMLLVTASTLLAQTPKLSYQMVVRNQKTTTEGKFNHLDLVYSSKVTGTVYILQNGVNQPVAQGAFADSTNMNGMLSLTIVGSDEDIAANEAGVAKLDKKLSQIKWNNAKIVVEIAAYGILDTMPVYPVPYALYADNHDSLLTTKAITEYINGSTVMDVDTIYKTIMNHTELHNAIDSTIVFYIKNNRTAVKNLVFHFLGQLNTTDVNDAYTAYKKNTKLDSALVDTVTKYIMNHYSTAKDIAVSYLGQVDKDDAAQMLQAIDGIDQAKVNAIADTLVGAAVEYINNHPEKLEQAYKKILQTQGLVTPSRLQYALDYLQGQVDGKTTNTELYAAILDTLDNQIIKKFLDNNLYLKKCADEDFCELLARVQNLENNPMFIKCPDLAKPVDNYDANATTQQNTIQLYSVISNIPEALNLNVPQDSIYFALTFPNSTCKDTVKVNATLKYDTLIDNQNDTVMKAELAITDDLLAKGQIIEVKAVLFTRCTPYSAQISAPDTIKLPLQCPTVVNLTHTSPVSADELYNNNVNSGVRLKATINYNYPEKIDSVGFIVTSKEKGYDYTEKTDTFRVNTINNDNTFNYTLDMSYCSRVVTVKPFLQCKGDNSDAFVTNPDSVTKQFTVRGPRLDITADPSQVYAAFADSIVLNAQGKFYTSTYTDTLIEFYANLAAGSNAVGDLQYTWKDTNLTGKQYKLVTDKDIVITGYLSITFMGATCKVQDTIHIKYEPYRCSDSIKVGDRVLHRPEVIISSDPSDSTYRTALRKQGKELVLSAVARISDTVNGVTVFDTINNMKATQMYDGIIKDYKYNWLRYNVANDTLKKGSDTIHVVTFADSNFVAHTAITLSNDTTCHVFDTIKVKYQFECGDSLRTKEHAYATVEVNKACWTKSNMRDTLNFVHGEQTGEISNGSPKYYNTSVLLNLFTVEQRGLLYNHDAAAAVCPAGWHLPDTTEWQAMLHYVDTVDHAPAPYSFMKVNDTTWRTTYIYKIGAADVWPYCTNGTSTVKFNAYPAGIRQINTLVPQDGSYQSMPLGSFWTATQSQRTLPEGAKDKFYSYYMYPETNAELDKYVYRADVNKIIGMSVRCVYGPAPDATPATFTCGTSTVTDRDNNAYNTVKIGNQCWMKENLRTSLPNNNPTTQESPAEVYPNNYEGNVEAYGLLYNYYAVTMDNLCPEGWRVPTQADFNTLIANVGTCGNNQNNKAKALAVNENVWQESQAPCTPGYEYEFNNQSGFSAYPAGLAQFINSDLSYDGIHLMAFYWIVSNNPSYFWIQSNGQQINYYDEDISPANFLSVRCIKAEN